ncbi:phosphonate C-P lyase system protein PhnH [Bordetella sp. 02P26C-1]|uniref:phosphonate C-P lyase system protein PhnH n=1 Tax=Bordetella sp. 02P26C-1 TaxID=2683195 RepID=UPI001354B3F2|nr:phosphonate C-P lyase system protein PhnH [Bordetella sp. 02P26C-1]MVW79589.1 phosphonate C-P lyase system protein PhnH [Bordetella sp. 02P26C-1]
MLSTQTSVAPPPVAGFVDTVAQSQQTFRSALQALAYPGRVVDIASPPAVPPGLSPAMAALLLTLADADTPVWLPAGISESVHQYLRFHCGCPLVSEPLQARFVAVPSGYEMPELAHCYPGVAAYPDTSATVLLDVESFSATDGAMVSLKGPGIESCQRLAVRGLPVDFWDQWQDNRRLFPMGVDIFLTQGDCLCGLPRTVSLEA